MEQNSEIDTIESPTIVVSDVYYSNRLKSLVHTDGTTIPLRPQSLAVFRTLAENANTVLSKDKIFDAVWGDVQVTDDSLSKCISEIRKAINDPEHAVLKTLPRQGYMLVSSESATTTAKLKVSQNKWHYSLLAIGALLILGVIWGFWNSYKKPMYENVKTAHVSPAILVTEIKDLTGESRWQRLARGITSELVVELSRNSWLRILQLESESQLTDEMNSAVQPKFVVNGTLQEENGQLRITSQLKERSGNEIVWSERWQRPANELFSIQDEILKKINSSIGGAWTGAVARHGLHEAETKPTNSLDAYELYLLAIEHKHKFTESDNVKAIDFLTKALEIDPEFGHAWSVLSIVYMNSRMSATSDSERTTLIEKQIKASKQAYELIPDNPEAMIGLSWVKTQNQDIQASEKLLEDAVKRSWNNPDVLAYATWAGSYRIGEEMNAIAWGLRAIDLNPNYPEWYLSATAAAQFYAGKPVDALETLKNTNGNFDQLVYGAGSYAQLGDLENAARLRHKALIRYPHFSISAQLQHMPILDPVKRDRFVSSLTTAGFK